VLKEADISALTGLTHNTVVARLGSEGYNELPSSRPRSLWAIAAGVVREPMFLLLLACGGIYLLLGDRREALMLLAFVGVVMGITLYQTRKTERALEALRDLSSPRALVIRDGKEQRIPGREVVRGDLLVLSEGDRVPADGRVLWCSNLSTDESLLSGESVPVRKRAALDMRADTARPGGDDLPYVYAGTLVVRGKALVEVTATGTRTEMGRIGKVLQTLRLEETPLQRETVHLVRLFAVIGLALCLLAVVVYGVTRGDWLHGLLAGLTMAMAILPEEFPVVLTVFLALGAWRIARQQVLTRYMPAVEILGSATVLCVDKTGTLTLNRMSVRRLFAAGRSMQVAAAPSSLPEEFHELIEFAILASQRDPFDPMEKALRQLGQDTLTHTGHLHASWSLIREYPLSPQLLALSHVWRAPDGEQYVIAAKGAPEAIADLCHLHAPQLDELVRRVGEFADDGLRVLGVARATFSRSTLPGGQHDFDFEFLGLVGLADPIRPNVPAALTACYGAGMRLLMITGDYPGTARSVAAQIGLTPCDAVITGAELDRMTDAELQQRIRSVNLYARVVPEQKLRLVNALKANGEVTAMTGDGVNDAPALKAAHIGIAMGGRGTDVARESASLVLLDDDFSSIVTAVALGRRIADNLRKAMAYILAVHVPIIGLTLLPVLLQWPLLLTPVHVVFLQLIIDPACAIVFEAEEAERDIMLRPPRAPDAPLFNAHALRVSALQGVSVLLIVLAILGITLHRGLGMDEARTMAFTTLVIANLALIFTNRSWSQTIFASLRRPNAALWWVVGGTLVFLTAALSVPMLRGVFQFARLHVVDLLICLAAGVMSILWFEVMKHLNGGSRKAVRH
jgi:P-type Ca2+ transporter type 2C